MREWLGAVQVAENASRCQAKRNALAKEYAELYPQVAAQLCDLFRRAEAIDSECPRVNGSASPCELRRLAGVELTARNLDNFSKAYPSIAKELRVPDFVHSDRTAWPPQTPQPSLNSADPTLQKAAAVGSV